MNGVTQFSGSFTFNTDPRASNLGQIAVTQDLYYQAGGNTIALPSAYGFSPSIMASQPPSIAEFGGDVSVTVNMGGQVVHYANTPDSPFVATFQASLNTFPPTTGRIAPPATDSITVSGVRFNYNPPTSYWNDSLVLAFRNHSDTIFKDLAAGQVANLGSFDLASHVIGLTVTSSSTPGPYFATITSIQVATVPEPSTLAIFAVLGLIARLTRCRREPEV